MVFSDRGFEAEIITDSVNPDGDRLTTMRVRYPRFIHAEMMAHRAFSRNTVSSRAVPVKKFLEQVRNDPALPIFWGANQPGMQSYQELTPMAKEAVREIWLKVRDEVVRHADALASMGLHKQLTNRLLEPWLWHTAIISSTDWDHFFHLRRAADVQPETHLLADLMFAARESNIPVERGWGQWSLPYVFAEDSEYAYSGPDLENMYFQKLSTARCARVSYLNHDGSNPDPAKDVDLHDKLIKAPHASPFEHPAMAAPGRHANFTGFRQYRAWIPHEHVKQAPYKRKSNGTT
jgi:thymidylate synthase ThyX